MKAAQLQAVVEDLGALMAASGAREPAQDLQALAKSLEHLKAADFEQFLQAVTARMENPVQSHLVSLEMAGIDREKFEAAFSALQEDKLVKNKELDEIGHAYSKSPSFARLYKSRAAKLKKLRDTFDMKRDFESRGQVIDRLLPWQ